MNMKTINYNFHHDFLFVSKESFDIKFDKGHASYVVESVGKLN